VESDAEYFPEHKEEYDENVTVTTDNKKMRGYNHFVKQQKEEKEKLEKKLELLEQNEKLGQPIIDNSPKNEDMEDLQPKLNSPKKEKIKKTNPCDGYHRRTNKASPWFKRQRCDLRRIQLN